MEVTAADIARVPAGNVRVPRAEFAAVWMAAERDGSDDWYSAGVALTCRWLATATVRPATDRWYVAEAPVTGRSAKLAHEELIESEYLAAEKLAGRAPRPVHVTNRPGWIEGVCATLRWAWRRSGPSPLVLRESRTAG